MKYLIFSRDIYNFAGGSEKCLLKFIELLIRDGNQVVNIVKSDASSLIKNIQIRNGAVFVRSDKYIKDVVKRCWEFQPDVLVGQDEIGIEAISTLRRYRAIKVFFFRGYDLLNNKFISDFLHYFNVDLVIANSMFIAKVIKKQLGIQALVSYPLVDPNEYIAEKMNKSYITMINYLPEKGSRIFKIITAHFPDEKFLAIRGWIKTDRNISSRCEKNLIIEGPYRDMKQVYAKTKLLVVPTQLLEAYSRVILEAYMNGIPVIASKVGGVPEAVLRGGLLVDDYNNPQEWVNGIRVILEPQNLIKFSRLAKENATRYSLEHEYRKITNKIDALNQERQSNVSKLIKHYYAYCRRGYHFRVIKLKTSANRLIEYLRNRYQKLFLRYGLRSRAVSDFLGHDRGTPIDRYYIEDFLKKYSHYIKGNVLEVRDNNYTKKYGGEKINKSDILVYREEANLDYTIVDDLSDPKVLRDNYYDCIILTQVLQYIPQIQKALHYTYSKLKHGGIALITVPGIAPISTYDYERWDANWMFTGLTMRYLLSQITDRKNFDIYTYGNIKSAAAFLYGYAWQELKKVDLDKNDIKYQVIVAAVLKKPNR